MNTQFQNPNFDPNFDSGKTQTFKGIEFGPRAHELLVNYLAGKLADKVELYINLKKSGKDPDELEDIETHFEFILEWVEVKALREIINNPKPKSGWKSIYNKFVSEIKRYDQSNFIELYTRLM